MRAVTPRSTAWGRKRAASGLCGWCPNPLNLYRHRCDRCMAEHRDRQARERGYRPRVPGGVGRPQRKAVGE
mgnify:CR=1 FL=1